MAEEYKGQNTRDAELKELPPRAFSAFREKNLTPTDRMARKKRLQLPLQPSVWQKASSWAPTLLPHASWATGARPGKREGRSRAALSTKLQPPLRGACPGRPPPRSEGRACPAAYRPAPGAARLVLIQTFWMQATNEELWGLKWEF